MAWTYILECADGSFYTGSTALADVEARVWQHNNDPDRAADFTRRRRPVRLAYAEEFDRIDDAFAREKQIQGWSRAKKLALIEHRGADLPALARPRVSPATSTGSVTGGATPTSSVTGDATSTSSVTGGGTPTSSVTGRPLRQAQ